MERENWIERITLVLETLDTRSLQLIYHFALGVRNRNRKLKK